MNTFWYIHTTTVYQFWSRWTRDDKYIPQLYINFPADEHVMICTYRNFISTLQQINTWWYIHTATLYQLSCRWTPDDIYIPKLYIKVPADEHVMIYTYRNFISTFLQMNTWWYVHTATLYQFSSRWTRDDIYIPQLYINFAPNEHWWDIHTVTLYQFSCRWTRDDIYIPQLYVNFPADAQQMIYTYRNFISTFLQMNTWWYVHTATLYQVSRRWTRDDIYIPQIYFSFPADGHVVIYTYCNFISTFLLWTPDDIYTLQLYINFPADEHSMIYRYCNFIWTFLQMNTFWYIHTTTVYQFWSRWTRDDK